MLKKDPKSFFVVNIMVLDFYTEIISETFDELREISVGIETLLESSVDDVIWLLKLFKGNIIADYSEETQYCSNIFLEVDKGDYNNQTSRLRV